MLVGFLAALLITPLTIRQSDVDLTPPELLPLGGYTERGAKIAEPGGDVLHARTLILRNGKTSIAVVSAEMLTIPESLRREVAARLPKDLNLFLVATHTHCAPDSQMLNDRMTLPIPGIATFKRKWLTWYADRIATGVKEALAEAEVEVTGLHLLQFHAALNRPRRALAVPDTLATMVVGDTKGGENALWFHYAAHPVFYDSDEMHTREDWPGLVAQKFATMVIPGAIGDVSPVAPGETPWKKIENFTAQMGTEMDRYVVRAKGRADDPWGERPMLPVMWVEQPIALDAKKPHPIFATRYKVPDALAVMAVTQFAPPAASVRAFRLGKLAVVGIPGEPMSELGRRIREAGMRMGFDSVLVCSHVDGWMGYILGPADYDRGGYEATLSFYGREEGDKVVAAGVEALRRLALGPGR